MVASRGAGERFQLGVGRDRPTEIGAGIRSLRSFFGQGRRAHQHGSASDQNLFCIHDDCPFFVLRFSLSAMECDIHSILSNGRNGSSKATAATSLDDEQPISADATATCQPPQFVPR
jgi:hypothetical protein